MNKLKAIIIISIAISLTACTLRIIRGHEKYNLHIARIVDKYWLCRYSNNTADSILCLKMKNKKALMHEIKQSIYWGIIFHSNGEYEDFIIKRDLSFDAPTKKVWRSYGDSIIVKSENNNSTYFLKLVQYNENLITLKEGNISAAR